MYKIHKAKPSNDYIIILIIKIIQPAVRAELSIRLYQLITKAYTVSVA